MSDRPIDVEMVLSVAAGLDLSDPSDDVLAYLRHEAGRLYDAAKRARELVEAEMIDRGERAHYVGRVGTVRYDVIPKTTARHDVAAFSFALAGKICGSGELGGEVPADVVALITQLLDPERGAITSAKFRLTALDKLNGGKHNRHHWIDPAHPTGFKVQETIGIAPPPLRIVNDDEAET